MIRLEGITKRFDDGTTAMEGVDLHVRPGEFMILLGASGCGKTTTLRAINRLVEITTGRILVQGSDVSHQDPVQLRRSMGYVIQSIGLFPHMSVAENVGVVPRLLGWSPERIASRSAELLHLVGLSPEEYASRAPRSLSGGQRQRIGLARALAAEPRIMLMDEPFGALDPISRSRLQEAYARLHRRLGLTTVMVTHDMTEALLMAHRIAAMEDGHVVQVATPAHILREPASAFVRRLMETPRRQAQKLDALLDRNP